MVNSFAFVRAVRDNFESDHIGRGDWAMAVAMNAGMTLGCDLGSMGKRFIAVSLASDDYRQILPSIMDDVLSTRGFTGLPQLPRAFGKATGYRCLGRRRKHHRG
ncbi:MAG: hypothetical protein EON84_06050 [Bradyrhizobiaceae bacterium]|nr:MAG: hypothetical protein EON84_06050 [Bradyrhizobiaceae bacterium]